MKRKFFPGAVAGLFAVFVTWSMSPAAPPFGNDPGPLAGAPAVSGTVSLKSATFPEDISLPGMAMVHVEILDLSGKNPGTSILGKESIWIAAGKLPVSFRIAYDPSRVDPAHVYAIRARIMENDKLLYLNSIPYYVLTRGAPSKVDVIMTPARIQ